LMGDRPCGAIAPEMRLLAGITLGCGAWRWDITARTPLRYRAFRTPILTRPLAIELVATPFLGWAARTGRSAALRRQCAACGRYRAALFHAGGCMPACNPAAVEQEGACRFLEPGTKAGAFVAALPENKAPPPGARLAAGHSAIIATNSPPRAGRVRQIGYKRGAADKVLIAGPDLWISSRVRLSISPRGELAARRREGVWPRAGQV